MTVVPQREGSREVASTSALEVTDLAVEIRRRDGASLWPVRGVSFSLEPGERLGLVGESGSGKSLTAHAIIGLLPAGIGIGRGCITLGDRELTRASESELAMVRGGEIAMIYQNPHSSLNPVQTIGHQLTEALRLHTGLSRSERVSRSQELLEEVGISATAARLGSYPHEFSGGMKQRVMIAMALAGEPRVLIADEITTALDVTTQARIIELLDRIVADHRMAVVLISHDLGVAARFCSRVAVMYAGRIVELAMADEFFRDPLHPYSRALLQSVCRLDADISQPLPVIDGEPLSVEQVPGGCAFAGRCPVANDRCRVIEQIPEMFGGRLIECSRLTGEAVEVEGPG
jgi:oligopeptide/dipeptide ABC transporter ATP-binding protein